MQFSQYFLAVRKHNDMYLVPRSVVLGRIGGNIQTSFCFRATSGGGTFHPPPKTRTYPPQVYSQYTPSIYPVYTQYILSIYPVRYILRPTPSPYQCEIWAKGRGSVLRQRGLHIWAGLNTFNPDICSYLWNFFYLPNIYIGVLPSS